MVVLMASRALPSRHAKQIGNIVMSCVGTAVAVWLVPASIEIVSWTAAGPPRVALFAPLSRLWPAPAPALVARAGIAPQTLTRRSAQGQGRGPLAVFLVVTLAFLTWVSHPCPSPL